MKVRPNEVKIDKETGLVEPKRGISLDSDPEGLQRFGGANEIDQSSIPDGLQIKQVGGRMTHYEIMPKTPMGLDQYQSLLDQIKFK